MGYRSEVTLVVDREGFANLCKNISSDLHELVKMTDNFVQKEDAFLFCWDHIKWYEDGFYPEISAISNALRAMDNKHYHFCRIGEDREDVEENGSFWDNPFHTEIIREVSKDLSDTKEVDLTLFI